MVMLTSVGDEKTEARADCGDTIGRCSSSAVPPGRANSGTQPGRWTRADGEKGNRAHGRPSLFSRAINNGTSGRPGETRATPLHIRPIPERGDCSGPTVGER